MKQATFFFEQNLEKAILDCADIVQKRMDELLHGSQESSLIKAMRYSAMSDGKRIRPFLVMMSAQIFGISPSASLNAAVAIEFIHAYSLIHDDLPAMDNDNFRRGKLTCHKKFDEATAILAGDALLTYAFEILSESDTNSDPAIRCELIKIASKAAGFRGMVGGQMIDLESANQNNSEEKLLKLHRLKTGKLFMASVEIGSVIGGAKEEERLALRNYADDFGLIFQIKDDLLDHKDFHLQTINDLENEASIVEAIGWEEATKRLDFLRERSVSYLKNFGEKARIFEDLIDFVVTRSE